MKNLLRSMLLVQPGDPRPQILDNIRQFEASGLEPEQPEDVVAWNFIRDFAQRYGHAPDVATAIQHHAAIGEETVVDRLKVIQAVNAPRTNGDFAVYLKDRVEERRQRLAIEAWKESATILQSGLEVGQGRNKVRLAGRRDAVRYLTDKATEIDRDAADGPKDLGMLLGRVVADYDLAAAGTCNGAYTGLAWVDEDTDGVQPGALWLIGGFAKAGKSTLALNAAYAQAVYYRRDVIFHSLEMPLKQVARFLLSMHQHHPRIQAVKCDLGFGEDRCLSADAIQRGEGGELGATLLRAIADDLWKNPEYGRIFITPPTGDATVASVMAQAEAINAQSETLRLLVIDYAQMLSPRKRSESDVTNQREIVRDLKLAAMEFHGGRGIGVLSPWQISRDGYGEAVKRRAKTPSKVYDPCALSRSSEAERSADMVMAVWSDDDLRTRGRIHVECVLSREVEFRSAEYPLNAATRAIWGSKPSEDPKPGNPDSGNPDSGLDVTILDA